MLFGFAAKYWSTGVFCRCGDVCRCIFGEHSNVVGSVCRRGEEVRPIRWSAPEIVRLMNDCHSASPKGNLWKGVFDSVVPSGIAIFVTADHGVVSILFSRCWGCLRRHSMSRMCLLESEGGEISLCSTARQRLLF